MYPEKGLTPLTITLAHPNRAASTRPTRHSAHPMPRSVPPADSAKAVELGAELLRKNENWYTLADPAGHPFDLCLFPAKQKTMLMGVMLDCPDAKELSTFYET